MSPLILSVSQWLFVLMVYTTTLVAATPPVGTTDFDVAKREPVVSEISLDRRQMGLTIPASSCATNLVCCNTLTYASDPSTSTLLALLGINISATYTVGTTCSRIQWTGIGTATCTAQPLCCWWGVEYGWAVGIDCTTVDLSQ